MARGSASKAKVFTASSQAGSGKKRRSGGGGAKKGGDNPDPSEAYTFIPALPKRHRTSEHQLSLSREERDEGPRRPKQADSDDEAMEARIRKVAMMIAGDDGGEVEDDDDEDVDSDIAWESDGSDEERWGEVFRDLKKGKGTKGREVVKKPSKPITVNLDETDDEESDPEVERSPKTAFKSAFPEEEEEDDDEDEDEEDDEDDEMDDDDEDSEAFDEDPELPSDLSDEDDSDDEMDGLDAFADSLATADQKKRKADSNDDEDKGKKRRVLPVMSAPGLGDGGDLALKSKTKVDLASLIASAPTLAGASSLLPTKTEKKSTSVLKGGVLAAPLPTVVQERLEREAAYEKTKEEGQKWSGVMKRVKEAEHLSFPLQASERGGVKGAGEVLATFKPGNEHESAVQALLSKANLTDAGVTAAEDKALQGQDLSIEEIAARRAELRHQRELMFRAESRAKRVSKIKSKTFRKLARKREARALDKNGEPEISLEDLERLDPEAAAEERERLERDRVRERATLRHGARTGRWAANIGADADDDARMAKLEMLEMKERLQRKIHAAGSDNDSEASEESGSDDDEDAIKTRAFNQLAALDAKTAELPAGGKGLANMAFMRKAAERDLKKVKEAEAALRDELNEFDGSGDESGDEVHVMKVGEGRMVFSGPTPGPGAAPGPPSTTFGAQAKAQSPTRSPSPAPAPQLFGANPWLDESASSGPSRKRNLVSTSAESKAVRAIKKAGKDKAAAADDEVVEISLDVSAKKAPTKANGAPVKSILKKKTATPAAKAAAHDSDSDGNVDEDLLPVSGVKAFTQRELVAEAFAGDNVVEDFDAEKRRAIEADAPTVEDTTLIGWGSWGGKGVKKNKRKPNPKYLKTAPGIAPEERKDAGRANVIITEKKDRKAAAFLPKDLPYPYTSVAQYEASFANPIGSEFNSRAGFQRETLPRVTKKPGAIIEPIRKLF